MLVVIAICVHQLRRAADSIGRILKLIAKSQHYAQLHCVPTKFNFHIQGAAIVPPPNMVNCIETKPAVPPTDNGPVLIAALCGLLGGFLVYLLARRHARNMGTRAATLLQSMTRRRRAYLFMRMCYDAVQRLQLASRRRAAVLARAATTVQKEVRRMIAQHAFFAVLSATIQVQYAVRRRRRVVDRATIRVQSAVRRWRVGESAAAAMDARALLLGELSSARASLGRRMKAVVRLETAAGKLETGCRVEAGVFITRVSRGHLARVGVRRLRKARVAEKQAAAKAKRQAAKQAASSRRTISRSRHAAFVTDKAMPSPVQLEFASPTPVPPPPPPPMVAAPTPPALPELNRALSAPAPLGALSAATINQIANAPPRHREPFGVPSANKERMLERCATQERLAGSAALLKELKERIHSRKARSEADLRV